MGIKKDNDEYDNMGLKHLQIGVTMLMISIPYANHDAGIFTYQHWVILIILFR